MAGLRINSKITSSSSLVPDYMFVRDLNDIVMRTDEFSSLTGRTLNQIFNAWVEAGIIDQKGMIWIAVDKLHTIIRVQSKKHAQELSFCYESRFWLNHGGKKYLHGQKVVELINRTILKAPRGKTPEYAKFSEFIWKQLRDCSFAEERRTVYYETQKKLRRKLKSKRIKDKKISFDELTGDPLDMRRSHFAHIRAVSLYPDWAEVSWNGIIVNDDTHMIMTKEKALNEIDLKLLCDERQWSIKWESDFLAKKEIFELVTQ